MISSLIKSVMSACKLQQKDLADVLDASLSRVKAITSGRVQKLKPEESEALVTKLGIHPNWLITQQGPMFSHEEEDETDDAFADRIQAINHVRRLVEALPLDEHRRMRLAAVMTGDPAQDAPQIAEAIRDALLDKGEQLLLDNYRRCSDEARAYLVQECALLAAGLKGAPAAAGASATEQPQVFNGLVTAVAGRDVRRVNVKQGKSRKNE